MPKLNKVIYLVEDDAAIADVYKTGLEAIGKFNVEVLVSCFETRKRIEKIVAGEIEKPDLVLLDLLLPECNGMQLLRELRSKEETKDIPLIILTNYGGDELKKMGEKLDIADYIIKTETTPTKLAGIVKNRLK